MGKTEVTVAQFRRFVEVNGYNAGDGWQSPGFTQSDNHPVVNVSWQDSKAYVDWLAKQTGKRYRLPSEAEQEYAIRAGNPARFAWGNDPSDA